MVLLRISADLKFTLIRLKLSFPFESRVILVTVFALWRELQYVTGVIGGNMYVFAPIYVSRYIT